MHLGHQHWVTLSFTCSEMATSQRPISSVVVSDPADPKPNERYGDLSQIDNPSTDLHVHKF
jgi:hypothetical protein